eukprot:scaffold430362_cov26-Prasinocladus_malaysianus.AAC.1
MATLSHLKTPSDRAIVDAWQAEDPPRASNPRRRWAEDRPDLAHLPLSERRRIRAEEEARARE